MVQKADNAQLGSGPISRRGFLRSAALVLGSGLLGPVIAACGGTAGRGTKGPSGAPTTKTGGASSTQVGTTAATPTAGAPTGATAAASATAGTAPTQGAIPLTTVPTAPKAAIQPATLQFIINHSAAEAKFIQQAVNDFGKKYPKISVKLLNIADTTRFYTKINTAAVARNLPDVWYTRSFDVASNAAKGWQESLQPYVERDAKEVNPSDIWPALRSQTTYKGQLYAMPYNISNFVVYYNKDLFRKTGVPEPANDWTWDDLASIGAKFIKKNGSKQVQWGVIFPTYDWFMRGVLASNGGKVFSDDLRRSVINSPENVATFEFLYGLLEKGIAPKSGQTPQGVDPFAAGLIAMNVNGSWPIPDMRAAIGKRFEWDCVMMPKGKTGSRGISTAGGAWGMSAFTKYKEESWTFLKYLGSTEGINTMVSDHLVSLPGRTSCVPAFDKAAKSGNQPPKHIDYISDEMKEALPIAYPVFYNEYGTIWSNRVSAIFNGSMSPAKALALIESDTNKVAQRYFK